MRVVGSRSRWVDNKSRTAPKFGRETEHGGYYLPIGREPRTRYGDSRTTAGGKTRAEIVINNRRFCLGEKGRARVAAFDRETLIRCRRVPGQRAGKRDAQTQMPGHDDRRRDTDY